MSGRSVSGRGVSGWGTSGRLLLVRHAPTAATRATTFPRDEPIDAAGRDAAATLRHLMPAGITPVSSPARRCRQTAAALGLAPSVQASLAECDFGVWAGRTLAELDAENPEATRAWMRDPAAAPHGGESLLALHARVGVWLAEGPRDVVAITHGGVIKSAVVHALGAPAETTWRIAVAPLSITELRGRPGAWQLTQLNWRPALPSLLPMPLPGAEG